MTDKEERKMAIRSRLSAQIKTWQTKTSMDVTSLAQATGMAENTIYRIKRCDVGASVDTITLLADAFNIPPAMLLMPIEE